MKIFTRLVFALVTIFTSSNLLAGLSGLEGKEISTYLVGNHVDVKVAQSKLIEAGFEIVATYTPVKKGTTIVFTSSALKAEGAKPKRAYAAVLRLFIDDEKQMISFTNPIYFGRAFMQDDYNHPVFNAQLEKINNAFPDLKPSHDKLKFDDLAAYHFMMGMPYYKDTDELANGTQNELIAKAKNYKKGKLLLFELKLSDSSTLLGYELGSKTKKFVEKVGRVNAAILPYVISIENGVARAMEAKYYIALSYPLLSMSEFTTIATVPGAISKDLEKPFK